MVEWLTCKAVLPISVFFATMVRWFTYINRYLLKSNIAVGHAAVSEMNVAYAASASNTSFKPECIASVVEHHVPDLDIVPDYITSQSSSTHGKY